MPFFNQNEQQRLMMQMFQNPQGGSAMPMPNGQGGMAGDGGGAGGTIVGPSFVGPGDQGGMGGSMPSDLGVEAPNQFNLPVPNIGDQGMVRVPPAGFNDNMPTDIPPGYAGDMGANNVAAGAGNFAGSIPGLGEDQKRRLIEAIIARGVI